MVGKEVLQLDGSVNITVTKHVQRFLRTRNIARTYDNNTTGFVESVCGICVSDKGRGGGINTIE